MPSPLPSRIRSLRAIVRFLVLALIGCSSPPSLPSREGEVPLAGGDQLHFTVVGSGADTVIVLAGGPMLGTRYLAEAFGALGQSQTMVFLDLRGRGDAPAPRTADSLGLDEDVADLEAARVHLGVERFAGMGHHWGSAVLLKYALRFPGHLNRAVLLAPFPHKAEFLTELIRLPNDTAAHRRHGAARMMRADTTDPRGYCRQFWGFGFSPIEEVDPKVVAALAPAVCVGDSARLLAREGEQRVLLRSLGTWSWVDSIPRLGIPTLVVVGRAEPALVAGARAWAGRLPEGRLLVTQGSGLFPWSTDSRRLTAQLQTFLGRSWPGDAELVAGPPDSLLIRGL